jgi:ribulose bisphosphate carboxylase small subunit
MTMPRKGTRKIVIGDKTYRYKVTHLNNYYLNAYCEEDYWDGIKLIIEHQDGRIFVHKEENWDRFKPFTPRNVREVIENMERCAER